MKFRRFLRYRFDYGRDIHLYLVYILFANIGFGVFTLIFNLYVYALDYREDTIGVFNSVQTFTMAATAMVLGTLVRRFGLWWAIAGGVAIYGTSGLGLALSTWAPALTLFSALAGCGLAVIFTTTMPFIIEYGRYDQRTTVATVAFSFASLSMTLGSLVGGFAPLLLSMVIPVVEAGSAAAYRSALIAGSMLGLAALLPLWRMGEPRRAHRRQLQATGTSAAASGEDTRQTRRDVVVFVLVGLITAVGVGLVVPFFNVYLQTLGANPRDIGLIYAMAGLAAAGVGLAAPIVSRRYGSLNAVLIIRGAPLPFFLLLAVAPWYGLAVVAHVIRQISINMAWPVDSTFISELIPDRLRASVFGWRSATWNLGIGVSSIFGGWLIVRSGYEATFVGFVLFTAASIALYAIYYRQHPRVVAGEIPSALSSRARGLRAVEGAEREAGTVGGGLPGRAEAEPREEPIGAAR
ncbi:MAG: MFS transporter [Chloroflexota bacterium]|nr:MFS transporter [Chloroflexota bacterium]